ncbi:ornithine cyclodeaminase family protein [Corticicoccus populi]|uniref:Ornithine cyclodeaminase family protein n=1 Tax=Corticicoccus populi TaxID=1812821 RepID=A0ABW5WT07_9STAP
MGEFRVLSEAEVRQTLDMKQVIEVVETVYKAKSSGGAEAWPTVFYDFEKGRADMDIKSGFLKSEKLFGHKTVTWFGDNEERGIPTLMGVIVVFNAVTGEPLGLTDASFITGIRTGAAAATGVKYLAAKDAENVLLLGAGNQALFQVAAVLTARPGIKKIRVAARNQKKVHTFIEGVSEKLKDTFNIDSENVEFEAVDALEDAVKDSDIIITITSSRTPVIKHEWVKKGTHFSCIGADMEGKQEIDSKILTDAKIIVDDLKHCMEVGEIEIPLNEGVIKETDITGEIGDLILGKIEGRNNDEDITVFDATGMALLDIFTANLALKSAAEKNLGTVSEI